MALSDIQAPFEDVQCLGTTIHGWWAAAAERSGPSKGMDDLWTHPSEQRL